MEWLPLPQLPQALKMCKQLLEESSAAAAEEAADNDDTPKHIMWAMVIGLALYNILQSYLSFASLRDMDIVVSNFATYSEDLIL